MPADGLAPPPKTPAWLRAKLEPILAGTSETLDLADQPERKTFPRLPEGLRGLKRIVLGGESAITRLPSWLADELPDLTDIDAHGAELTVVPVLPGVTLDLSADTIHRCAAAGRDVSDVTGVGLSYDCSSAAVQSLVALSLEGQLRLRRLHGPWAYYLESGGSHWRAFDAIVGALDALLAAQPALESLELGLPLGRVPDAIRSMDRLVGLTLGSSDLGAIPGWVLSLPLLSALNLFVNRLADLPDLGDDPAPLRTLNIVHNQFELLPDCVFEFIGLETLWIGENPLREIDARIARLPALLDLWLGSRDSKSSALNHLVTPPPEVAAKGIEAIRDYWRQQEAAGVDYLDEAKLLIVGEPGAGKTTLAKKLLDPTYVVHGDERSTEGIDIVRWTFPTALRVGAGADERLVERTFAANVWDFGGQEIYHATHQFFLTKRSLYVLVADERKENTDFDYWLEIVNLLGGDSPVVIVNNRKQGRLQAIDAGVLRRRFTNVAAIVQVDLADNDGLAAVVERLRRELEALPHVGSQLPRTWRAVRDVLVRDESDYITLDEFHRVCGENGFTRKDDMLQLAGYLHDLGICLHFQDDPLLRRTVILKPEWGTSAVYRVLDDTRIVEARGRFGSSDLVRLWDDERYADMRDELLQLMTRFGLCFKLPGGADYLAPQLLPASRPTYPWDDRRNAVLRYEYDVMPKGILQRLIVALHHLIGPGNPLWLHGVVFDHEGSRAEVVEDYRRRRIDIRLAGGEPKALLSLIDNELSLIHRTYTGLAIERYCPCDCETCRAGSDPHLFAVRTLTLAAAEKKRLQCPKSFDMRDPSRLLYRLLPRDLVTDDAVGLASPLGERPAAEVYVSYSTGGDSEALVEQIERRFADMGVVITRDKKQIGYRDSLGAFMRRLGTGRCVIVVLSDEYLRSKYCMYELVQIAANPDWRARVFPVVLSDAFIYDAIDRVPYIKHWQAQGDELEDAMREISLDNQQGIRDELDRFREIRTTMARIIDVLADMNTLTPEVHRNEDYGRLFDAVEVAVRS